MSIPATALPELITSRLILNQVQIEDAAQVFILRNDKLVNKYVDLPETPNEAAAANFIHKVNDYNLQNKGRYWAIRLKDNPRLIGSICLWNFDDNTNTAELGFTLLTDYWRKGYMQEALQCVLQYGFDDLHLTKIDGWTHQLNEASIGLMEKVGFTRNFELEKQAIVDESEKHMVIYTILNQH